MNGVSPYVIIAYLVIAAAAYGWHMAAEHHVHRVLLHVIDPDTDVPDVSCRSWWHRMPHWRRLGVHAVMAGAAIAIGMAWGFAPWAGIAVVVVPGVTAGIFWEMRRAGRPRDEVQAGSTERKAA